VLIHASLDVAKLPNLFADFSEEAVFEIGRKLPLSRWKSLDTGAIIGSVEIVDCVINHTSIWAEKSPLAGEAVELPNGKLELIRPTYNWVLAHPIRFPEQIPIKGRLSFWDYPNILAEPEEEGGELFCHCQLPVKELNQVYSMIDHHRCHYCGGRWYK